MSKSTTALLFVLAEREARCVIARPEPNSKRRFDALSFY
jgi:hypothetical protein